MLDWSIGNLRAWMEQAFVLAATGSLLLAIFRIRHPWTKLAYCHTLLAICLALPWIQPWRRATAPSTIPQVRLIIWLLLAGGVAKLGWLLAGLWRIRKCRISSMPMYPIPASVRAASAVTQADALFCVSSEVPGPVMLGWLTPVVLLPESFLEMAEESQCGVACHELLHVRRHDWLVTVLEELAGTLLWFNPAIWPLLAQTRLAREQVVDAEVVRLTASREPYIDALLAIARGGSGLDLAPAPLFLRRRHLTQRVHLLLRETATSKLRLVSSYASITAILALAGWLGVTSFPLVGRAATPAAASVAQVPAVLPASAPVPEEAAEPVPAPTEPGRPNYIPSPPVPPDPHELATAGVRSLTSESDLASARALFRKAQRIARLTTADTPPYRFDATFTAAGNVAQTGPGQLLEIRRPGHRLWTADLAGFSVARWTDNNFTVEDRHVAAIPMRVEALRDAIYWAVQAPAGTIRSAAVEWNGKPTTCLLFSAWTGQALLSPGRLWEETEYCIDDASSALQIESIAPGIYTVYDYSADLQFHGRPMPDRITIYNAGELTADAQFSIADMSPADQGLLTPDPARIVEGPIVSIDPPARAPLNTPNPFAAKLIQPVIVEAVINDAGRAIEVQLCAAADPALVQTALDLVKNLRYRHRAFTQYQIYVNVKFMPSAK
jgi:beta-lactamase regulating signal transducer with metallopeptidase domain